MRRLTRTHCRRNAIPNADTLSPQCGSECVQVLKHRARPTAVTIRYVKVAPSAPTWPGGCRGGCSHGPRQADLALRGAAFVAAYEMGSWVGGFTTPAVGLAPA